MVTVVDQKMYTNVYVFSKNIKRTVVTCIAVLHTILKIFVSITYT